MYLKKLEIQGFKSFADKTLLELQPGITLIVGPNGSGKSNIADAVRWVLGEQSVKSLRGGKMEDVIFAGSEKRRSLGMAEVSITIDNTSGTFPLEFNEVTVTRRLYRSGESDYLINRVPCRLKDVHELFMDTGVGREGFSIIGQGKIDEVLAMKPEERRGLLEEAAGIVKYRYRKREAEKKLEDTRNSLVRLNDIMAELTIQEEPLAEQAKTAEIYQGLKSELDALEIGLILDEAQAAARKLEGIQNTRVNEEKEREEITARYYKAQAREEEDKLRQQKIEESISVAQEKVYTENLRIEKNESEKKLISERITDLLKQEESLGIALSEQEKEITALRQEDISRNKLGEELNRQLEAGKDNLKTFEEKLAVENQQDQALADRLENLKEEHFEALQEESRLHNDKTSHQQRLALLKRQEEQLSAKQTNSLQELDNIRNKLAELEKENAGIISSLHDLEQASQQKEKQYQLQDRRCKDQVISNRSLAEEKNNISARLKVLLEMEQEGQGYYQGVKEILRRLSEPVFNGIVGTVAQVMTVPKEYELAVEVVLGGSLQHLIAEDEKIAQHAILWLKKNDKGRVTFLPLTTVKGNRGGDHQCPSGAGVIGKLSELVRYEKKYAGIMDYLLGRVYLVEDLASAVQKAKETNFSFRMVTPDGQLVNAGGSLTGGSMKANPSGILSRRRNISELNQTAQKLKSQILRGEAHEKELTRVLEELEKSAAQMKEKQQEYQIKKAENGKSMERWSAERDRAKAEIKSLEWQSAEIMQEKDTLTKHLQERDYDVTQLQERIQKMALEIQEQQEALRARRGERVKKNEHVTQLRIDVATIQEKIVSFQKDMDYYNQRLKQLAQQKNDKKKELVTLRDKRKELEETCQSLIAQKGTQHLQLQEIEKQLEELKQERVQIQEQINKVGVEVKKYGNMLRNREEKIHQIELQQSKYETALEGCLRRLNEQFALTPAEAEKHCSPIQSRSQAVERIAQLKEDITNLGTVNLSAIEEYKKLTERLTFLNIQVNDMSEAKEKLLQVIKEMDQIMTRKFRDTFQQVDQCFQEMFKRLFGGGRAQLAMTAEEDPLEAGIEIIAQPPGKKTQSLTLLSGGEKALTAIALLMAMLKIKPSPFCVLDEIESNLDEANVLRFAQLLQEFSQQTQFIAISHHRGTMEIAHVLYGVTIEESGISRLISVRLEDAQKEAS